MQLAFIHFFPLIIVVSLVLQIMDVRVVTGIANNEWKPISIIEIEIYHLNPPLYSHRSQPTHTHRGQKKIRKRKKKKINK